MKSFERSFQLKSVSMNLRIMKNALQMAQQLSTIDLERLIQIVSVLQSYVSDVPWPHYIEWHSKLNFRQPYLAAAAAARTISPYTDSRIIIAKIHANAYPFQERKMNADRCCMPIDRFSVSCDRPLATVTPHRTPPPPPFTDNNKFIHDNVHSILI